jgi:hypothetical protein
MTLDYTFHLTCSKDIFSSKVFHKLKVFPLFPFNIAVNTILGTIFFWSGQILQLLVDCSNK